MRLVVLDSALRSAAAHHFHFAHGLACASRERGLDIELVGHRDAAPALLAPPGVRPVFTRTLYDRLSSDRFDAEWTGYDALRQSFSADLRSSGLVPSRADVFFLPTAVPGEIAGLGDWLDGWESQPRVAALFHWGVAADLGPGTVLAAVHRQAAKRLVGRSGRSVWLGGIHRGVIDGLSPIFARPMELAPSVTFYEKPLPGERPPHPHPVVGILGASRVQKGSRLVPQIVRRALREAPAWRWSIQHQGSTPVPLGIDLLADDERVTVIAAWLDEASMIDFLTGLDVALLPYDRETYRRLVSGVFTLAAGYGVPCIVPSGTWMADRIAAGEAAGLVYPASADVAGLIAPMLGALTDTVSALRERARRLAPAWRRRYSAETLIDRLVGWANG